MKHGIRTSYVFLRWFLPQLWRKLFPPFDRAAHERDCDQMVRALEDHHGIW
jgi:hypothetical protein